MFLYPNPIPEGDRPALTITNPDGDFAFTAVPPGSYRLGTNKLGFFPTPGIDMPAVTLDGSGADVNVELTMSKGGALAGRVSDQSGRPLRNVWVGALRVVGLAELEQAIPSVAVARTNDVGEYRVDSLQPGDDRTDEGPVG
jgi:protocatechuate 3,4-dioxygenase beta subunit